MGRTVKYLPDGVPRRVSGAAVVEAWRLTGNTIPAKYAVGTAQHESAFAINEVDVEPTGFASKGIFQIADSEATSVGFPGIDLLSLNESAEVFARLSERNLDAIIAAAHLDPSALPADTWAYLAIAHNQGLGRNVKAAQRKQGEKPGALGSIADYGMDWEAYKARNPNIPGIAAYGDDVISGGKSYPSLENVALAISENPGAASFIMLVLAAAIVVLVLVVI